MISSNKNQHEVDIVESYKDYEPPNFVIHSVRKMIYVLPDNLLSGLKTVVLTNAGGLSHKRRRRKTMSRGKKVPLRDWLGVYHRKSKSNPAWIEIFIDHIVDDYPGSILYIPILREMMISKTLYHEIGHHIHLTQAPEHREKEDVADKWSIRLERYYFRKQHPICIIILYPLVFTISLFFRKNIYKKSKP